MTCPLRLWLAATLFTTILAAQEAADPPTAPGLQLTITSNGASDVTTVRRAAWQVAEKAPPTPFLEPGPFTASFVGQLNLDARSRLYFSFAGNGKAKLTIGDEVILEAADNFTEAESKRIRLNKGSHPIRLDYESPAKGPATLRLLWRGRDFATEPVPSSAWTHQPSPALEASAAIRQGRHLVGQQRCTTCHAAEKLTANAMPELQADAPDLTGIGSRLNADWLASWLIQPAAMRPTATMPALFGHDSVDAAVTAKDTRPWDIAAYLTSLTETVAEAPSGDADAGGAIFHELGCIACHQAPDKPIAADDKLNRIPLNGVKAKFKPAALVAFLKDPTANYKWVRMPHFQLSDKEAAELAALLLKHAAPPTTAADAPVGDPIKGKALVAEMGCMNCHSGPDKTTFSAPAYASLAGKDWHASGCVAPPAKRGKAPQLNLSDADRTALAAFGKTDGNSLNRHHPAEFAERQIEELNCTACHVYNGIGNHWDSVAMESKHFAAEKAHTGAHLDQSRPKISNAGAKLNTDWLQRLLAGETAPKSRPWLAARMPAFPSRAEALAAGMAAQHGIAPCSADQSPVDKDVLAPGKQLLGSNGGFACIICHAVGNQKAVAPFESKGINLMLANERLRHDYYMRWMLDPPRIDHATKMPKYAADGTTPLTTVLEGDAKAQFDAIWEFLKAGRDVPGTQ